MSLRCSEGRLIWGRGGRRLGRVEGVPGLQGATEVPGRPGRPRGGLVGGGVIGGQARRRALIRDPAAS